MEKKLIIAGNVIGELSDKIPSNIIALNELIKNSYDAGAKEVSIILDTTTHKLIVIDDGKGMDDADISILLQVSKSEKKYGTINPETGRYTQGSKGLGFLSVFKFGDIVTWTTISDKKRCFSINYQDLVSLDDISEYTVQIEEEESGDQPTGTMVEILLKNTFNHKHLSEYLLEEMNRDKILNSFIDNKFNIKLTVDNLSFETKKDLSLSSYYSENQLFHVQFSSADDNNVVFTYMNHQKYGIATNSETKYKFSETIDARFKLSIDLMIFDFSGSRRKNGNEDKLFIIHPNKLTPLIYINKNLFNNYTLFDPELMRYSQSSISLPQMIGYIEIISADKDIQFNSDRTQFQENELTEIVRHTLENINKVIQKTGSDIKARLKKATPLKPPPQDDSLPSDQSPNDVPTPPDNDGNKHRTNRSPLSQEFMPVVLDVMAKAELVAPTDQIDLRKYIQHAKNSKGESIDKKEIKIEIDGVESTTGIMETIDYACKKTISYSYCDANTGFASRKLIMSIVQRPLQGNGNVPVLIPNIGTASYKINFKINPIVDLVTQLNELFSNTAISYNEVIACSLRALFELSINELEMAERIKFKTNSSKDSLAGKVTQLISAIRGNGDLIRHIKDGLGRSDYHQLRNEIEATDFEGTIKKCHLGAHRSTGSLSQPDLCAVGNVAALFLSIVNELLNNPDINWGTLGKPWEIE